MDTRTTSADFYPGGKTPVTAGGGITSGEGEAYNGEQRVPITSIEGLPERFTEGDMKSKIDDICKVLRTGGLALAAILSFPAWGADGITVHGARKDKIFNDGFVVTNVTADLSLLTTNDVCNIVTNEVVEWTAWEVYVNGEYKPGWSARIDIWEADEQMAALCINENGAYLLELTSGTADELTSWTEYSCSIDYVDSYTLEYLIGSTIRVKKERIIRNALGLARIKDIEKLPTHETVTNVARSVVNSVWDASLGVAWEARMHNGHLYYIAVTNRPPEGK